MLFTTDFDASIALLTFFRLMRTVPSPHTSIKTDLIDISYRGTGTGIEFYYVTHKYHQYDNSMNTYVNYKSYEVHDQDELATLLCYDYLGRNIKDIINELNGVDVKHD